MKIAHQLLPAEKRGRLPEGDLSFGALRTDHMFIAEYSDEVWHSARIVPYGAFSLMPGAVCLHYGQTIFEGIKAFRHPDDEIYVYRLDRNIERMNHSADIMCMPHVPEAMQREAIMQLIDIERHWCPSVPESSLYVRPFAFGTQDTLGVKPSNSYIFAVMLSPSGPYYPGGFSNPLQLLITKKFHRAVSGGTGTSKCGGNYAASLRASEYAKKHGAGQVLYLDASNEYIEEVGSMNHYHVLKDGTFIIPEFNDSILRSITSLSVLELALKGQLKARTEHIRLEDFLAKVRSGEIIEAGGLGTAAVVSPVGSYLFENGEVLTVGNGHVGEHSRKLYENYSAMQTGRQTAPEGWLHKVPHYSA